MTTQSRHDNLTSNRVLAANTVWNLLGQVLPMAVALVAVPVLVHRIGTARFGVLSLSWLVIGYFGLFDLGTGRALTGIVADRMGANRDADIPIIVRSALVFMFGMGCFGTLTLAAITPWLVHAVLKVPQDLQTETVRVFYLLALSLPLVTSTSGLRGVLEAKQRFGILNAIRTPMSMLNYGAPLLVLPFSTDLAVLVLVLVVARFIGWLAHLVACVHALPEMGSSFRISWSSIRPVLRFGAWLTVSNTVSPLLVYVDRFSIGAMVSMSALAYYTAPAEIVSRLSIIPAALVSVLFPALALTFVGDPARTATLVAKSTKHVFLVVFPMVAAIVLFAPEGLTLWLGPTFAAHSTTVLRWMAIGTLINCVAQVPFTCVQAVGRPDLTAKLHLIELPLYLLGLRWAVGVYGIEGAAVAWTARVVVDALFVFGVSCWVLRRAETRFMRDWARIAPPAVALFVAAPFVNAMSLKLIILAAVLIGVAVAALSEVPQAVFVRAEELRLPLVGTIVLRLRRFGTHSV